MRFVSRIVLVGIALVATVGVLVGCGGGGGSDRAKRELGSVRQARCDVLGAERRSRALQASIAALKNEPGASDPGPVREEILRSMQEDTALISRQLPSLENCPRQALRTGEGGAVPEPAASPASRTIAVAHRLGAPRIEPGEQAHPASPCSPFGKNGVTTVYIVPDSSGCIRVKPGERLRVKNLTGIGGGYAATSVRVRAGDYEMWLAPGQEGRIPAPVETYFGRGAHSVGAVGGLGPTVLVLPEHCALGTPVEPGEELCFR